MFNKKEFFVLINAVLFLTACEDNNDKILKELKKINHRQGHQYSMQLQLRREDDDWKAALTNQEKIEHIKFQNEMRKLDIKHFKEKIGETLQELKKLNKKGFTDKFPIRIRAYALSEETSFFIRLLLMTLDSVVMRYWPKGQCT